MYEQHFGFSSKPFALTPDPAYLYPSRQHARALTMLDYGLESQAAFSLLTGDIGSGKTTLLRELIRDWGERVAVGLISNTHVRFQSIHGWALSALGVTGVGDSEVLRYEALVDAFIREYARGRRTLLILDEAQNLSVEVLEELRLLSNVNSDKDLILQIMLVGQPELRAHLARPELRQFAQRISVDFHLRPLDLTESHAYIRHRLGVAQGDRDLFPADTMEFIFAWTGGVPRLLNQLCDMALVYAFSEGRLRVDLDLLESVIIDRRAGQQMTAAPSAGLPEISRVSGSPA